MPIFWKEVTYLQINEKLILQCLNELNKNSLTKQIYKDYYEGNHAILKNYTMQDSRSNMRLVFNYPRKFVNNETGYLLAKPVNYVSKLTLTGENIGNMHYGFVGRGATFSSNLLLSAAGAYQICSNTYQFYKK